MKINLNLSHLPDEIVFCRHAQSTGNAVGKDDASTSTTANHFFGLSNLGKTQPAQVKVFLEEEYPDGFDDYYISTFLRTELTFKVIYEHIVPFEDPRIDEWWKGIFHSLSAEEITKFYPHEKVILEREGWYHYQPPQGESGKNVELRILSFLSTLTSGRTVFICGHGRWSCFLDRILCGKSRSNVLARPPKNCSVIRFKKCANTYKASVLFEPV